ncbi:MAG TPA: hypothetical protein VF475_12910 [Sphingobium sp.]
MNFQTMLSRESWIANTVAHDDMPHLIGNEVIFWCERGVSSFSRAMGPILLLAAIAGTIWTITG